MKLWIIIIIFIIGFGLLAVNLFCEDLMKEYQKWLMSFELDVEFTYDTKANILFISDQLTDNISTARIRISYILQATDLFLKSKKITFLSLAPQLKGIYYLAASEIGMNLAGEWLAAYFRAGRSDRTKKLNELFYGAYIRQSEKK